MMPSGRPGCQFTTLEQRRVEAPLHKIVQNCCAGTTAAYDSNMRFCCFSHTQYARGEYSLRVVPVFSTASRINRKRGFVNDRWL